MRRIIAIFSSVWTYRVARLTLAGLFVVSGSIKLSDIHAFSRTIKAFAILPSDWAMPLAAILPGIELAGGILLVLNAPGGLLVIGGLLLIFIGVLANAIRQGLAVDCGCYGPGDPEGTVYHGLWPALWRDLAMLAAVLYCLAWRRVRRAAPPTPNQGDPMRALMLSLVLALLATVSLAPMARADKFEDETAKETEAVKLVRDTQKGGYALLSAEELKKWIDEDKKMVIVDTMPFGDSYKKGHVPGAVNFLFPIPYMEQWDAKETDGKTEADYAQLLGPDKDIPVVVYCGFVKCTRSHNAAVWAKKLGYKNVYRFPGGIFAWKGADYPLEAAK